MRLTFDFLTLLHLSVKLFSRMMLVVDDFQIVNDKGSVTLSGFQPVMAEQGLDIADVSAIF